MVSSDLLKILVCPESKQKLRLATEAEVSRVNASLDEAVDQLLVREDSSLGYPVRDGIPVMLVEEALALQGVL